MKRLFLLFLVLALLVIIPFLIWGDFVESRMSLEQTVADLRRSGRWAWLVGIGLLVSDLFLPILGTIVMSALGFVYGWLLGGIISSIGSISAGVLAYWVCRKMGRSAAIRIAGEKGLIKGERIFHSDGGGFLVAISRWMPVFPEVIACLAGLSRMPFWKFLAALIAGSIPMSFVFAWIGEKGQGSPFNAILISAVLPPVIWAFFHIFYFTKREKSGID